VHLFHPSLGLLAPAQPAAYYIRHFIHHFGCCIRHFFITVIDYMNVVFLIMHQISTRINDTTLFRANKILWLNLTVKYSFLCIRLLGFVGFVVNHRSTDGAMVSVQKSVSEKEFLFIRLRVRKITFFRVAIKSFID
jgi:hypothetical protein